VGQAGRPSLRSRRQALARAAEWARVAEGLPHTDVAGVHGVVWERDGRPRAVKGARPGDRDEGVSGAAPEGGEGAAQPHRDHHETAAQPPGRDAVIAAERVPTV
jgi:hypothetical protein